MVAAPAGALSDRFGRVPLLLTGRGLRIVLLLSLALFANGREGLITWTLFLA